MPLQIKPHTARLFPPRKAKTDAGEMLPLEHLPDGPRIGCNIRPVSTDFAIRQWGVELKDGYQMLCEVEDGKEAVFGALVWWDEGKLWLKVEAAQEMLASPQTRHTQVALSKMQMRDGRPTS
jgi:hypothetical protein